jgi:bifunctional non-homologous end joining protein LigD
LKFDGYRALAIKMGGKVLLRSRNDKDFNGKYPSLVKALASLPNDTVVDGDIGALDESGRPSFSHLQKLGLVEGPDLFLRVRHANPSRANDAEVRFITQRDHIVEGDPNQS